MEWIDPKDRKLTTSCWPSIPPLDRMELGYQMMVRGRSESQSANPEWRRLTRMIEWHDQQKAIQEKEDAENAAILRDQLTPIFSSSLEAGRIRERLAARARARGVAGMNSHVGA